MIFSNIMIDIGYFVTRILYWRNEVLFQIHTLLILSLSKILSIVLPTFILMAISNVLAQ